MENTSEAIDVKLTPLKVIKQCEQCNKEDEELFNCSSCKKVYYCNVKCQRKHWKTHKSLCNTNPVNPVIKTPVKEQFDKITDFLELTNIGQGNFTSIVKGKWKQTGKEYAIKVVNKQQLDRVNKHADIFMEKHVLSLLKEEENIVNIHATFQDDKCLYMVMDYLPGGELWTICKQFGLINSSLINYYLASLLSVIKRVHAKGIVHRDIKPENVLLNDKHEICVIDFGTARDMDRPEIKGSGNGQKGKKTFDHFVGTPNFMAPEQIRNIDSNFKSDVWALGSLACQLVTGFPAFVGGSDYLIFKQIVDLEEDQAFLPLPSHVFPEGLEEWIRFVLVRDVEKRPTLKEAMEHPYFQNIDFNNIKEYASCSMNDDDLLVMEFQKTVIKQMKMNKDILNEFIQKYLDLIVSSDLIIDKQRTTARIQLMNKQMQHYFKMEEYQYKQENL